MTTRRHVLTLLGGATAAGATALAAGCREPSGRPAQPAAGPPADVPLLLADTTAGLVAVRDGEVVRYGPAAVVTAYGSRVFATKPVPDGRTALLTFDPLTGADPERVNLDGDWVPRVTSVDERLVALTAPGAARGPRARTALLIADRAGPVHRFDLAGNVEPDAFNQDGSGLFGLEWLPPEAPDRYRVRLLDFPSGATQPLNTRDKVAVPAGAEEEMRGEGRQAVLAPHGDLLLYTLYTHQPGHRHTRDLVAGRPGGVHAFVHCLHLGMQWAYCLDLPHPFGEAPANAHALAVSADGRRLLVADVGSGSLAVADTETLTLSRVAALPTGAAGAADSAGAAGGSSTVASAVGGPDGRTFVGAGRRILAVDEASAAVTATWTASGEVRALAMGRDGGRLCVATDAGIDWLDSADGGTLGHVPLPGVTAVRYVR